MAENLMNNAHKASTPASRAGWDRIWGKTKTKGNQDDEGKNHNRDSSGGRFGEDPDK